MIKRFRLGVVIVCLMLFVSAWYVFYDHLLLANNSATKGYLPLVINSGESASAPDTPLQFVETFDGEPTAPQPWDPADWDVTVHSRDVGTWDHLESMQAGHGPDCGPPPATHAITAYEDAVYLCRNHMMTAINASGYGVIYLTPNHMIDFSDSEAVIRLDISTLMTSDRDWWDVWITPYAENLQLPLQDSYPDLSGPPRRAVQIVKAQDTLRAFIYEDFQQAQASEFYGDIATTWWVGYSSFLVPDAGRRDTFEIRLSQNHLQVGMPDYDFWWIDSPIDPLDWNQGVVQFGHHSYNPTKDCTDCDANTWHWDNIQISPAIPFTIVHADRRVADASRGSTVSFAAGAPLNAHLRFAGIGNNLEVSFDSGVTWHSAQPQSQQKYDEGAFWSYWMPIPVGASSVQFRGESWWGGDWQVRDLTIWARDGSSL